MTDDQIRERVEAELAKILTGDGAMYNVATKLGTTADPRMHNRIRTVRRELSNTEIDALLENEWGIYKFVSIYPADALRKWISLSVVVEDEGAEGEKGREAEEQNAEAAKRILDRLAELNAKDVLEDAGRWDDAYGGAMLLPLTSDNASPEEMLDLEQDFEIRRLDVLSRKRIAEPDENELVDDSTSPMHGWPEFYRLNQNEQTAKGVQGAGDERFHYSRAFVWRGWRAADPDRPYRFGQSKILLFKSAWEDYQNAIGSAMSIAHRIVETKIGMEGLRDMLSKPGGIDRFRQIMQEIMLTRSTLNAFPHDKNDTVEDTSINMSGVVQIIDRAQQNVAAAAGISQQRFFGLKHEGLSDNDETGAERDEAAIAQYQSKKYRAAIDWLIELVAAEQKIRLKSWDVTFNPQREETAKSRADRHKIEMETARGYVDSDILTPDEVREKLRNDPDSPYRPAEEDDQRDEELARAALEAAGIDPDNPTAGAGGSAGGGEQSGQQNPGDPAGGGDVKVGVIQAVQNIVIAVSEGELPAESGIQVFTSLLGMPLEQARAIINPASTFAEKKRAAVAKQAPPPAPDGE